MNPEQIIARQEEEFDKRFELESQGCSECGGFELLDNQETKYPKGKYHCEYDLEKIKDWHSSSIKEILEEVKQHYSQLPSNYPIEVFTEPPTDWQKELDEWCKSKGFRIDNISAHYARWQEKLVRDDTINNLSEIIKKL